MRFRPLVLVALFPLSVLSACGSSSDDGVADTSVTGDTGTTADTSDGAPSLDAVATDGSEAGSDARADATADATGDTTADGLADAPADTTADTTALPDAPDAGPDPLAALGTCLGTSAPLTISNQLPYMMLAVGSYTGQFLIDVASTFSSIDLKAFTSPGPATTGCDPTKLFVTCTVDGFAFFSPPGAVSLVTENFAGFGGSVRQAGIVGTDFTSLKTLSISYSHAKIWASAPSLTFCSDSTLAAAGFRALPTTGFYSNDFSKLKPMSAVDSAITTGHVPAVPTVPVRIAGADAVAQLDTGFDDALVKYSINVNKAFYDAIVTADASALVADPSHNLSLSTCTGSAEPVKAYKLASGRALELLDGASGVVRKYPTAEIFVKTASPHACGGIGTWTTPAAQMAASFFVDMGSMIFDPYTARVWITP